MSLVVDTPRVAIRVLVVGPLDNNVYLLTAKESGEQILIDAAADAAAIEELLAQSVADAPNPRLALIVTTHAHDDHCQALAPIQRLTGARTAAGRADAATIEARCAVKIDQPVDHLATIEVSGLFLTVIALRGHTPGSIGLAYAEPGQAVQLFSGDSLFPGGVGNTEGDPARFSALFNDVSERIFAVYGDDTVVWPGHGLATTLGAERPQLAAWRARGW